MDSLGVESAPATFLLATAISHIYALPLLSWTMKLDLPQIAPPHRHLSRRQARKNFNKDIIHLLFAKKTNESISSSHSPINRFPLASSQCHVTLQLVFPGLSCLKLQTLAPWALCPSMTRRRVSDPTWPDRPRFQLPPPRAFAFLPFLSFCHVDHQLRLLIPPTTTISLLFS